MCNNADIAEKEYELKKLKDDNINQKLKRDMKMIVSSVKLFEVRRVGKEIRLIYCTEEDCLKAYLPEIRAVSKYVEGIMEENKMKLEEKIKTLREIFGDIKVVIRTNGTEINFISVEKIHLPDITHRTYK